MANTRDLLNKVLRGLRQFSLIIPTGTNSTSDEFLQMLLQFANEAKEEVEESGWSWQALRATVTLTVTQGTIEYDLTSAGPADIDTSDRSRLLYENATIMGRSEGFYNSSSSLPMVFDVTTSSENRLHQLTQEQIERLHFQDNDEQGPPHSFAFYSDGDSKRIKLYPTPSANGTIKLRMYLPQDELVATDLTTVLKIPFRPVWTRALFKANEERGSELGKPGSSLALAMMDAQGAATGAEMTPADQTVNLER